MGADALTARGTPGTMVEPPTFDPPGGTEFPHSTQLSRNVDIRSATNNAQIRYTIDGTEPDEVGVCLLQHGTEMSSHAQTLRALVQ